MNNKSNIAIISISGSNLANINYLFDGRCKFVSKPEEIDEFTDCLIMPGNSSYEQYYNHFAKHDWMRFIPKFLDKKGNRLVAICAGFQFLGTSSEEAPTIKGLGLIPSQFKSIKDSFGYNFSTNIGRKKISLYNNGDENGDGMLSPLALKASSFGKAYFCHSYGAQVDSFKKSHMGTDLEPTYIFESNVGDVPIFAGFISRKILGFQFHPELSGGIWKEIMLSYCTI